MLIPEFAEFVWVADCGVLCRSKKLRFSGLKIGQKWPKIGQNRYFRTFNSLNSDYWLKNHEKSSKNDLFLAVFWKFYENCNSDFAQVVIYIIKNWQFRDMFFQCPFFDDFCEKPEINHSTVNLVSRQFVNNNFSKITEFCEKMTKKWQKITKISCKFWVLLLNAVIRTLQFLIIFDHFLFKN